MVEERDPASRRFFSDLFHFSTYPFHFSLCWLGPSSSLSRALSLSLVAHEQLAPMTKSSKKSSYDKMSNGKTNKFAL